MRGPARPAGLQRRRVPAPRVIPGIIGGRVLLGRNLGTGVPGAGDTLGPVPGSSELPLLDWLTQLIIDNVASYGYAAIFVLMVLESACIPIPSEVTMVFGGALVSATFLAPELQLEFWPVVVAGTLGNLVGSWIAYWVGYVGGRPFVARWGRYVLIRPHEVDRAHDWFERYGEAAVFFGRLLPVVRTFISLPAGVVRMPFWKFTVFTVLGCLPWSLALTWLGYELGERWETVERILRPISWAVAIAVLLAVVWFVWHRIRMIRAEEAERTAVPADATEDA
jgi:membrane protein DedA with SNARE-associated domain